MTAPLLPRVLHVGPYDYKIVSDTVALNKECRDLKADLFGVTDTRALQITLDPKVPTGVVRETLLHETLHTIFDVTALSELGYDDEEKIVRRMAPILLDVMRRNGPLVKYLLAP